MFVSTPLRYVYYGLIVITGGLKRDITANLAFT